MQEIALMGMLNFARDCMWVCVCRTLQALSVNVHVEQCKKLLVHVHVTPRKTVYVDAGGTMHQTVC